MYNISDENVWEMVVSEIALLCCSYAVLEVQKADGISDLGAVKLPLALSLLAVFFLVYFSLWKGVKSTGKVIMSRYWKCRTSRSYYVRPPDLPEYNS